MKMGHTTVRRAQMNSTIRIKRSGPGKLYFEVYVEGAIPVLTSAYYSSICKLEAGLALLFATARSPNDLLVEPDGDATRIGLKDKRGRVPFVGRLVESLVQSAISTIASAQVVDDRPPKQRRTDLSGSLCDLNH
jgi:hypothetical protein